ncbi:MAG: omptin family outer membrane protease [Spirochaetaceae bacterium]|jgi:outer membrane protease|nr:omptin family outer membrane protease [Spirochaetaceae bacterium]
MKKIFLFGLFLIMTLEISAQELSAGINNHTLFLGGSIGLLNGVSEEIVYRDRNTKNKLSQLLWDLKPLVYVGIDINYAWRKPENTWGVFADTSFKVGIPGETGVMEDRDWMNSRYPEFLTHYSVHENKTKNALFFDLSAGISFQIFNRFLLKTYLAYDFMHFSWSAGGGSLLYPDSDGGHGYLRPITVITYQQTWNIVSPGIAFYGEFNRYFNAEVAFKISPLIWTRDKDNHVLRDLVITDTLDIGLFVEPSLLFSFTPRDFFILSFSASYRNISHIRGDGVYRFNNTNSEVHAKNMLGAGYSAFDLGLTAKFKLRRPVVSVEVDLPPQDGRDALFF